MIKYRKRLMSKNIRKRIKKRIRKRLKNIYTHSNNRFKVSRDRSSRISIISLIITFLLSLSLS